VRDLRAAALTVLGGVLAQYAIGMVINLFVTIPAQHPGAQPSNYFSGSAVSLGWTIAHGAVSLTAHAVLGVVLVLAAAGVAVLAVLLGRRSLTLIAVLAAACILGAGFNGVSFLDFNQNVSSLIMALLAAAAIACYTVILYLLPGHPES
jgi:hypothetical protein